MAKLEANTEPVGFDHVAAQRLIAEFRNAAQSLRATRAARRTAANLALVDWKGPFAQRFASDMEIGDADAERLAATFERAADQIRVLERSAEREEERRAQARRYQEQQDKRSRLERFGEALQDLVGLGDDEVPPPPPPEPQPVLQVDGPRLTPAQLDVNRK